MLAGATVDFQDYNEQVLEMLTYPSVMANWQANRSKQSPPPPVKYFSGDWGTLGALLKEIDLVGSYDIIVTTETIYTLDGMSRLFQCIKEVNKSEKAMNSFCFKPVTELSSDDNISNYFRFQSFLFDTVS
jgi:hypothetical protein